MERIYFDNAATTALDPAVLDSMMPYLTTHFGNPSSIYSYGRETRMAVEMARKKTAKILNTTPGSIFFTSGGTESINTILKAAVRDLGCTHIISSPIEHHATMHTLEFMAEHWKTKVDYVKLLPNGHLDLEYLENLLKNSTEKTLVALMHANNEIGNMLDLHEVGNLCKKYDALFFSDTVQTVGHFPFDLKNTPVDFITAAGHKFHGPKGVGMMYINEHLKIKPLISGGAQERAMRAGTENIYGIVGFAEALDIATKNYEHDKAYISGVRNYMMEQLKQHFDNISFNGDPTGRSLYTVLNVNFPKTAKTEMILMNLDMQHICASGGSACSSGAEAGSHVIHALNPDPEKVAVRFSFCKHNSRQEVDAVINVLKDIL